MMQSIEQFYESKEAAGVPKHYTHDIGEFEVKYFLLFHLCPVSLVEYTRGIR